MSEQRYVLVPARATDTMIYMADHLNDTFAPVSVVYDAMLKAAPPPPESVLSRDEKFALMAEVRDHAGDPISLSGVEIIERAVLAKLTEQKS